MTQIAGVLTVATVFIGLWTLDLYYLHLSQRRGGLQARQKLEPKVQGGVIAGFYVQYKWYMHESK